MIMLLAINPGWKGQSFLASTFSRMEKTRELIAQSGRDILLCVDGGITRDNIGQMVGVDIVVTGSAVFDGKAPLENVEFMTESLRQP